MGLSIGTLFPLRLRLWFGRLLFRHELRDKAVRVSWHRLIKGPCDPTEVEAMQYVAAHTSIPIPKLYKIHTTECGHIYIEMEYVHGRTLSKALPTLSADQRPASSRSSSSMWRRCALCRHQNQAWCPLRLEIRRTTGGLAPASLAP